jgi:hypothetical protein
MLLVDTSLCGGGKLSEWREYFLVRRIVMRKFLVLILVMSLANFASATTIFKILVNGQPHAGEDLVGSDDITVIVNDPAAVGGFGGYASYKIDVSAGDFTSGTVHAELILVPSVTSVVDGDGFIATLTGSALALSPVGDVGTVLFHVPNDLEASTDIVIAQVAGAWNNDFNTANYPSVTLHVIPEPMTLSLLALGGLSLIRRRRA